MPKTKLPTQQIEAKDTMDFGPSLERYGATEPGEERRIFPRRFVILPAKMFHHGRGDYVGGVTSNVSISGALLCIDREKNVCVNDVLDVAIDWDDSPVLREEKMKRARIVRVTPMDFHHQAVAVQFVQADEEAKTAMMEEELPAAA